MNRIRLLVMTILLCLTGGVAFAQATGEHPKEPYPEQYEMSCAPGDTYRVTTFNASDCKTITADGTHAAQNILFPFGSQWKVTSAVASAEVCIILHTTETTTITNSTGLASTGQPVGATRAQCLIVDDASSDFMKISKGRWLMGSGSDHGYCSVVGDKAAVGGPCSANADCGSGGTCDLTRYPRGLYASICNFGTTGQTIIVSGCNP